MHLEGKNLIGNTTSATGTEKLHGINPVDGKALEPAYTYATETELDTAVKLAEEAFKTYKTKTGAEKATFLEQIAVEIEALGDTLINRYVAESALPAGRATGERGRTMGQQRLFASLLREGSWVNAIIDKAMPDRQPLPRTDLRSMERPLGPVAVFGASNFPLAFSVAGGDTVSALAAGCPVVFKAHPSHPGTSELVGKAIIAAAQKTNMPEGVFSMIYDGGIAIGQKLVVHPLIKAVGFTGSYNGGKAIFDSAMSRPEPIPVYAEMGSTNPVFVLPGIIKQKSAELAAQYLGSVTLGVGQFCTNPGVLVVNKEEEEFLKAIAESANTAAGGVMLNEGIKKKYVAEVSQNASLSKEVGVGQPNDAAFGVNAQIRYVETDQYLEHKELQSEVFGPYSIVVGTSGKDDLLKLADQLSGHLTASIFGTEEELGEYTELIQKLEQKVGRLIFNEFPTGVEVCHAMVHGGPFPATSDARSTSVGTEAIKRFTRPVCFQNMPDALLPVELKNANPLQIWRKVNGEIQKA